MPQANLSGRTAVVTGAGRGIGAAVARALAAAGTAVVVTARTLGEIRAVAAGIRESGGQAHPVRCDVARPADVARLAREARKRFGSVDILVNNAGIGGAAPIKDLKPADWNRMMAVNAGGTFLCTKAFLPDMMKRGRGRVVNVASTAAYTAGPYIAAYAASKHAVLGFTRAAAQEAAPRGVTVNAVCPGWVDTAMAENSIRRIMRKTRLSRTKALAGILDSTPQKRLMTPEEVAATVLHLCSEEAAGINGQGITIDGGGVMT